MKQLMQKLEAVLEIGGTKRDIAFLIVSAVALLCSIFHVPLPFDAAWVAIVLCGIPIILEAIIGLVTEFDIKADVLVSLALIASVFIGEIFAAGEVAFIMQLGGLLEELTVARARAGIEKLVQLTRKPLVSFAAKRNSCFQQNRYRSTTYCASCRVKRFRLTERLPRVKRQSTKQS